MLRAEGIVCGYGEADIVKGASVSVGDGEIVCIIGPNGAGKSTLLKCIFGLVKARAGKVTLEGKDLTNLAPNRIVGEGLAYVPQVANVFAKMTVDENLDMGAFLREEGVREAKERVYALFPDLQERRAQRVGSMSGGQRQMVAIGRALMLDPRVLLLDEPSAGLAPMLQDQVFEQVRRIADNGTPVLLVEQNAKKALAKSDRGVVLDQGKNAFEGRGSELLDHPEVGRLYLGGGARTDA
ncbi:MAG TPA: ABC transporter ATP-binding protein [Candidatus Thermoplasmatota archaeon]|nr:ABC transporter ATP-binding protein [Candidatus Thermoplasmatota archaeon]